MRGFRRLGLVLFLLFFVAGVLVASAQDAEQEKSLGEVARESRANKPTVAIRRMPAAPVPQVNTPNPALPSVVEKSSEVDNYIQVVSAPTSREDFAALDKMADEARSSKSRFPGGGWKLFTFYVAMQKMPAKPTEEDWQKRIDFFQRWVEARPKSITARVALAAGYEDYAWVARGHGYADTVTDEGWRLFGERIGKAGTVLIEAAKLDAKCPQWYVEFQQVGRAGGLDKEQLRQIFEKGVAFAPDYYYLYQQEAISLLPKWGGAPGDVAAFLDESYRRVGGDKGAMLYFQIASNMCGVCGDFNPKELSWPILQTGFVTLEKTYGLSPVWINKFAKMAVLYLDKPVAEQAFARIGDNWEQGVWGSWTDFNAHRTWAMSPEIPKGQPKSGPTLDAEKNKQLNDLYIKAVNESAWKKWDEAAKDLHDSIDLAKPYWNSDSWLEKAYSMLANNEQLQGHMEQARSIMDEELQLITQRNGVDSTEVANALDGRGNLELRANDDKAAEADFLKTIAIREQRKQAAWQYPSELYSLATAYLKQNKNKEVVALLTVRIPTEGENDPRKDMTWARPLEALGTAYQNLGQYQQAEQAYKRMIAAMDLLFPAKSIGLTGPLQKMASLYHAMGKQTEQHEIEDRLREIQQGQPQTSSAAQGK